MKIAVDHDFVSLFFEALEPAHETTIFREGTAAMIIWHHQQGANRNAVAGQFRHDFLRDGPSSWRDVMHGNDQSFPLRFSGKGEDGR